jgi:glucose-1-phosphate cytidylyltransferase
MVLEPEVLDLISGDQTSFEEAPMRSLAKTGQLSAFKHNGFWKCMDTLRDKKEFDLLAEMTPPPWYEGL